MISVTHFWIGDFGHETECCWVKYSCAPVKLKFILNFLLQRKQGHNTCHSINVSLVSNKICWPLIYIKDITRYRYWYVRDYKIMHTKNLKSCQSLDWLNDYCLWNLHLLSMKIKHFTSKRKFSELNLVYF